MTKRYFAFLAILFFAIGGSAGAQTTISVFDTVLFFDGYAATVSSPPPPAGVLRLRNDLFSRMLSTQEIAAIGNKLSMEVVIKAACDNYDRIGSVNLAMVPKGATSYKPDSVQRLEIGRFITPFMNKNLRPDTVPYRYNIDNIAYLLKESSLTRNYDFWVELEVFGVPYAANTQVAGCSGRNDVFYGSLKFTTSGPATMQSNNVVLPLQFRKDLNNYQAGATDTLGKTVRVINFNVPSDLSDAALFLVTSNHGANAGGEEYNRRNHFVTFDDRLVLQYVPGSETCEPFRVYNTQGNGIYGPAPRTPNQWQSFSNWCPGDTIPTRRINLGALPAGAHSFRISVPDAQFVGGQGYIPVSLYLHGKTSGSLGVAASRAAAIDVLLAPNPAADMLRIESRAGKISGITVSDAAGRVVLQRSGDATLGASVVTSGLANGSYFVRVRTEMGVSTQRLQILR